MTLQVVESSQDNRSCLILSGLFSLFCVGGAYLDNLKNGLPEKLSGRPWMLYAVLLFVLLSLCFYLLLILLFRGLDRAGKSGTLRRKDGKKCRYGKWMEERPFLTGFLSLLLLYVPCTVISYPGLFMGDVGKTLMQGFGFWSLFSHQPPMYTLLFSALLRAGAALFHSWNAGAMTAALAQMLLLITVIAWGNRLLILRGLRWEAGLLYLVYFAVSLVVSNYMMLLTKDVWYAAFFFLWIQGLADLITERPSTGLPVPLAAGMLGMLCFRNEAILVLLLSLCLCALAERRHARPLMACAAGAAALYGVLVLLVYPALGIDRDAIDPNSRRDLFSIVYQQTARTVQTHRNEITTGEETAILSAFSFDSLDEMAAVYSPDYADEVKNHFEAQFGSEEARAYFQTWREMGKKYPKSYLMAVLANYYQYFYPLSPFWVYTYAYSGENMALCNEMLGFTDFHHPDALARAREWYENLRQSVYSILPFSLFNGSGLAAWIMMIATARALNRQKKEMLALLLPLWVVLALCLFSPCNGGYGRYQYPIFIALPWIVLHNFLGSPESVSD